MKVALVAAACVAADGMRMGRKRAGDCYSPYDGKALLHLTPCSTRDVDMLTSKLQKMGCKLLDEEFALQPGSCADAEAVCSAEAAADLKELKQVEVTSTDAGAHYRNISGVAHSWKTGELSIQSLDFYRDWRDFDSRMAKVEELVASSGGIATIETAGTTLEGRPMKLVRFTGNGYQSGGIKLFYTFNLHAREWVGGMSGIYAIEKLVEKVQQDPHYLDGIQVLMMPMSNPDGFIQSSTNDRMHRKNMRQVGSGCYGVDVNRNFDAHWAQGGSSNDVCSDTYHGPNSMSEPETNVIAGILKESPLTVYVDVHAYSKLILEAYGWTKADNPRKGEYSQLGKVIQSAIKATHGESYTEGPIAQTLYEASGSTVDYADDLGALGLCIELRPGRYGGGGFAPPASEILPTSEENFAGILATIDYVVNPPAPTPAPPPTPSPCPHSWCSSYCWHGPCQQCPECR